MATLTMPLPKYPNTNDRSQVSTPEKKMVVDTAKAIATYYIPFHLRKTFDHHKLQGLPKHYLIPPQQPPQLYSFIANICTEMESDNSDFFNNLPESMNLQVTNAKTVFKALSKTVFSDDVINWGRVLSVFTLAATLAVHFTKKGQLQVVTKIPQWLGEVIEMELADWIIAQGGWDDAKNQLSPKSETNWSRVLAYGGVVAAAGILLFRNGKIL